MSELSHYFDAVAIKRLSQVEANASSSNQHEFNGVAQLKPLFGVSQDRQYVVARHIDMESLDAPSELLTRLTWYNSRAVHPSRNEWRLYYTAELARSLYANGTVVFAKREDEFFCFTSAPGTHGEAALQRLFGIDDLFSSFERLSDARLDESSVDAAEQLVLAQLGIAYTREDDGLFHLLFDTFGDAFPRGEQLSAFVRENTFGVDAVADPDDAIITWARVELELFNAMEARVETFAMDEAMGLDEKLAVAMRVFQRRRSRAGKAFEYHLRAMLDANAVFYSANPVTENGEEPDFVLPGISEYRDANFPSELLTVLAAKQTVRDRWRQIMSEANRVPEKHLATLDTNLSPNQVRAMSSSGVQLVLPLGLHFGYPEPVRDLFITMADFVWMALDKQNEMTRRLGLSR